jgi:enoyl-CoA hydratase
MSYEFITYEKIGAVARINHNRPQMRNAENKGLLDEMDDAVTQATEDKDVRCVIIGGTGEHFSAGHDLKEGQMSRAGFSTEARWEYEEKRYLGYCMRIWDMPKPVIAQVQGACIAGGFMVAAMADLVVASDDAFFSDPVLHTLGASAVEVLFHPWALGLRQAKDILFTGRRITAKEAHDWGFVSRLVPRAELESATLALAEHIAKAPPFAMKITKRSLNRTFDMQGFRTAIEAHFDTHQLSHTSTEWEAIKSKGLSNAIQRGKTATAAE